MPGGLDAFTLKKKKSVVLMNRIEQFSVSNTINDLADDLKWGWFLMNPNFSNTAGSIPNSSSPS